jgi:hypothetical protein
MRSRNRPPIPAGGRGGGSGNGKPNTDDPWKQWRQWKYWCHSCGCNLNHDSKDCRSVRRKTDHKDEATKTNPMNGNVAKDELWQKWWNPANHKPYDKPE